MCALVCVVGQVRCVCSVSGGVPGNGIRKGAGPAGVEHCASSCRDLNKDPGYFPRGQTPGNSGKNAHKRRNKDYEAVPPLLTSELVGCGNSEDTDGGAHRQPRR